MLKTIRVTFSKTGRAKYISHLDLNRTMSRALRRAAIPIWYTEGFNRHPYVTFAAPLSLGFEGLQEHMDFRLEGDMPMEEIVHRLNDVMPEGLRILSAHEAADKAGDLASARYRLVIGCRASEVEAMFALKEILVEKRTKKKTIKLVDIQPVLAAARAVIEDKDGSCTVELTLPCSSNENINPMLILSALQQYTERECIPFAVTRMAVYNKDGKAFA